MSWQHKFILFLLVTLSTVVGGLIASCYIFLNMQRPACYPDQALVNVNDEYICLNIKDLNGGL